MQTITAGQELTAAVLNDWTPQAQSDTCTAATNFTVTSFTVYSVAGVTWFSVQLSYSGSTLTGSSAGNITDTQCCTLPFAPQATAWLPYQTANTSEGIVSVQTSGLCTLLTLSPTGTLPSGNSVSFSGIILTG